jgi:hypothetical protein
MTRVRQIFVDGQAVIISTMHIEIARLIYGRRPYCWGSEPTPCGWDDAPAMIQIEFLELAHAVLAHPIFASRGAGQPGAEG